MLDGDDANQPPIVLDRDDVQPQSVIDADAGVEVCGDSTGILKQCDAQNEVGMRNSATFKEDDEAGVRETPHEGVSEEKVRCVSVSEALCTKPATDFLSTCTVLDILEPSLSWPRVIP